ncbi:hypothetical protein [Gimesia fumaroli]|uniref:Uncharacterized protein n=1 Tax=Gimesia fumaroli TaxID=2527976 RepID=A0A518I935_9PLAN|nr:hypothetical protein [Gimesia fumaroli]QDV49574.1 hypothetical protein Enr17x_15940 [Gimesia fumaroli]
MGDLNKLIETDGDSVKGKLILLIVDKLFIGVIVAIVVVGYDWYQTNEQREVLKIQQDKDRLAMFYAGIEDSQSRLLAISALTKNREEHLLLALTRTYPSEVLNSIRTIDRLPKLQEDSFPKLKEKVSQVALEAAIERISDYEMIVNDYHLEGQTLVNRLSELSKKINNLQGTEDDPQIFVEFELIRLNINDLIERLKHSSDSTQNNLAFDLLNTSLRLVKTNIENKKFAMASKSIESIRDGIKAEMKKKKTLWDRIYSNFSDYTALVEKEDSKSVQKRKKLLIAIKATNNLLQTKNSKFIASVCHELDRFPSQSK